MRRWRIDCVLKAALALLLVAGLSRAAQSATPPNIVLIMCDDMGYSDLGCYGGEIKTPRIDRLAEEGVRFTQFYNNAKCSPTRAALLSGCYPQSAAKGGPLPREAVTIPEVLASAGYVSFLSGKWHLKGTPRDRGFARYYGLLGGCCNFFDPALPDPPSEGGKYRYFAEDDRRIRSFADGFYTTDAFTDRACQYIDQATLAEKPFFLYLAYTAPHHPLHALPADIAKYRGRYRDGWQKLRIDRHRRQVALGVVSSDWTLPPPDPEVQDWNSVDNHDFFDHLMAVYAAQIDRMDQGIGRVLAKLDERRVAENTLVMFLSDNGGCAESPGGYDYSHIPGTKEYYLGCGPGWAFAQNTPFRRYKRYLHEGGISTPMIVRWPGVIKPGTVTNEVCHVMDVLPTCADVAGIDYSTVGNRAAVSPCAGVSLRRVFEGHASDESRTLYWEFAGNRAVRDGRWKLCWDNDLVKRWELYDMVADRTEMHDCAEQQPHLVQGLSSRWFAWAEEVGVKFQEAAP